MLNQMTQKEFSAGGIIIKKTEGGFSVLLIKDGYSRWTWPKGKIEGKETPEEAAKREIKEEVGLALLNTLQELDKVEYFYRLKGKLIFKTVYLFLFEVNGGEKLVPLKSEIKEAVWFSVEAAVTKVEYKGAKELLEKALESFKKIKQ